MINICINIINREFKFHITTPGNATLEERTLCDHLEQVLRDEYTCANKKIDDSAIDITPKQKWLKGSN